MDLHVHTGLSPCASEEMSPPGIVRQATARGVDILAVTDHNSAANALAVMTAGRRTGLTVVPGMELQTREDVHLLCLFESFDAALEWQEEIYRRLPARENREDVFGPQWLYDDEGRVVGKLARLLSTAAAISLEEAVEGVGSRSGVAIPAHIDRPGYGLLGQLGFVPPGLGVKACEVSRQADLQAVRARSPGLQTMELVCFSDAHQLSDIGDSRTTLWLAAPTLGEIEKSLEGSAGRRVAGR